MVLLCNGLEWRHAPPVQRLEWNNSIVVGLSSPPLIGSSEQALQRSCHGAALTHAGEQPIALRAMSAMSEKLLALGVDTVFGLPGDGINGIFQGLRKNQDKIRFIQVRHAESAAFMACAYAKFTGRLGACFATSGPGAVHLLNGLHDAKLDGAPVPAITGHTFHDQQGRRRTSSPAPVRWERATSSRPPPMHGPDPSVSRC